MGVSLRSLPLVDFYFRAHVPSIQIISSFVIFLMFTLLFEFSVSIRLVPITDIVHRISASYES